MLEIKNKLYICNVIPVLFFYCTNTQFLVKFAVSTAQILFSTDVRPFLSLLLMHVKQRKG